MKKDLQLKGIGLPTLQIIPYSETYKENVIKLLLDIWEEEFDFKGLERPDIYDVSKFYRPQDGSNFWLALENNELIGTVGLMKKSDNSAHLKRMAVKKHYREKGIGEKLLQTALDFAKQHDIKTIYAGMVPENVNAIKFYKNHGFSESDFVPDGIVIADDPIC